MKAIAATLAAASLAAFAATASAQTFQKPEDAIKYRKASFTVLVTHFGPLAQMANGRIPYNAQVAARSADVIAVASTLPWAAFGEGTDKGDTRAKPEVWSQSAKFKENSDRFQAEMAKLAAAAKTGNLDNLKAAFATAGGTCKACHDDFRRD